MAISVNNANIVFKDYNGNIGKINSLTDADIAKISANISNTNELTTVLNSEISARANADVSLDKRVTTLENTSSKLDDSYVTINTDQTIHGKKVFAQTTEMAGIQNAHWIELSSATPYIDFHYANSDKDYTARIIANADNFLYFDCKTQMSGLNVNEPIKQEGNILIPTGTIIPFAGTSVPAGYLLCNGAQVSRTTFARLFNVISTQYGSGDGSTTFALPDLKDRFLEGANTYSIGAYISAGLPNVTGTFKLVSCCQNTGASDAFKLSISGIVSGGIGSGGLYGNDGVGVGTYNLSNNRYNSIYNSTSTVQPKALSVQFLIKY